MQHWAQSSPQDLINLYALPSLLLTSQRYREREQKEGESHKVQSNTAEWEDCGAGQTNSVVCANKSSQRSTGEVKEQEYQLLDHRSSSSTLTSHDPQPGEQRSFVGVKVR